MSTLQVANVHFETTGANRIEYTGNNIIRVQANGGFQLPAGTTAERPTSGLASVIRFNTDTGLLESYNAGSWATVPDGPTFSGAYNVANAAKGTGLFTNLFLQTAQDYIGNSVFIAGRDSVLNNDFVFLCLIVFAK